MNTKNRFYLLFSVMLLPVLAVNSATIDFDANYNEALTGGALISEINKAVNAANSGDIIVFKSSTYDFAGATLTLSKGVMIKGKYIGSLLPDVRGTHNIQTTFLNVERINIRNNNVKIRDLILEAASGSTNLIHIRHNVYNQHSPIALQYTGIEFINNECVGGKNHINAFNGVGILVRNCQFTDYTSYAYTTDRRDRLNSTPQAIFEKNIFKADLSKTNFNLRAISFDAGNDEFPGVWDHSGTIIKNNLFDGTGIAYSKCSNSIIEDNTFYNYSMVTDLVHFEEYSADVTIRNNTFEFKQPSRGFFIDREGQPTSGISIVDNTFIGKYGWIISAYSPRNFVFTGNDFTSASANNNSFKTFDFGFTQPGLEVPGHDPLTNIIFENNTGLTSAVHGVFRYYEEGTATNNTINTVVFNEGKIERTAVTATNQVPIYFDNKIVKIRNKATGEYIYADGTSIKTGAEKMDRTDEWEITYRPPFQYVLRNVSTQRYLEVEDAFTLGHIQNNSFPQIFVENKWNYNVGARTPDWFLKFKSAVGAVDYFELHPGGNEHKSSINNNSTVELSLSLERDSSSGDNLLWEFIDNGTLSSDLSLENTLENHIKIYPNPVLDVVNISAGKGIELTHIDLYNLEGVLVYTTKCAKKSFDIERFVFSNLAKGNYILKVQTINDTITRTLIIQ